MYRAPESTTTNHAGHHGSTINAPSSVCAMSEALAGLEAAVDSLGERPAFERLYELMQRFSQEWDRAEPDQQELLRKRVRTLALDTLLESAFFRHAYVKPRGYAGDYIGMKMVWEGRTLGGAHRYCGSTRRGELINSLILGFPNCAANEQRVHILRRHIADHAGGVIASIGSGPMIEAAEALRAGCSRDTVFHPYDQDPDAIAYAIAHSLSPFGVTVRAHPGNVSKSIVREPQEASYDLLYSSGMYDYFECGSAARLTGYLWKRVRPGGTLLITNAHPNNPSRAFMDAAAEWQLVHKTEAQMRALAKGLPDLSATELERDDHGVYQYLCLRKA